MRVAINLVIMFWHTLRIYLLSDLPSKPFLLWSSSISSTTALSTHQIPHSSVIMAQQWRKTSKAFYYYYQIKGYFDCLNVHFTWMFKAERVCEKCCCFTMPAGARVIKISHKQALLPKHKSFLLFHIQGEENLKTAFGKPTYSLSPMSKRLLYSLSSHFISWSACCLTRFGGLLPQDVKSGWP